MTTPIPSTTEHGWPFATGPGQVVDEHSWETMASTWQVSGVVGYPETGSVPSTGNRGLYATRISATQIEIQPGVASIAGHFYELKFPKTFDLDITGSVWAGDNTRQDVVTLRLDRNGAGFQFVQLKNAIDMTGQTLALETPGEEIPLVQLGITNGTGLTAAPIDRRWFAGMHVRPIRGDVPFLDPAPRDGELGVDTTNNFIVVGQAGEWVPASQVFNNDGALAAAVADLQTRVTDIEAEPAAGPITLTYSISGSVTVGAGTFRIYNDSGNAWTVLAVRATVGTAPTGGTNGIRIDVNKNGTSIFASSGAQPAIAVSTNTIKTTTFATSTVADGEYLTVDVDTIGATVSGSNLVVQVVVR
ncbi:hypothetical protein Ssi03_12900 [Sphaerisporangium siamense]|uniref:Uncharacterized protein n=1 Tax=Sphaerisporangium siamense TaxID=795645 RepID=A0A7W7GDE4_9ACTN|nr:hypothetical protein [Sphaerisporangium siamense]MBB4702941.1 hypothetical protein [Sphaerisporangium siamense]GII83300.1 hypothetical protein Ssi03_12900 [Sphaerisporangium siamense]